ATRSGDDHLHTIFANQQEFKKLTEEGVRWETPSGPRGFAVADQRKIPIYIADNSLLKSKDSIHSWDLGNDFLKESLIVMTYAPDSVRKERLLETFPALARKPDVIETQLSEHPLMHQARAHVIVNNSQSEVDLPTYARGKKLGRTSQLFVEA